MKFNSRERESWSDFFGTSREVAVTVGRYDIQMDGQQASAKLDIKIVYRAKRLDEREISKTVRFAMVDGKWEVVSWQ